MVRVLAVLMLLAGSASADTRGTLRLGLLPLDLESSSETPLFGDQVDQLVTDYNAAAAAFDRRTGGSTPRIDAGDLGVAETLVVIAPGIETGSGRYLFRIEAPIGLANDLTSIGIGLYPIGVQGRVRKDLAIYASGGGTASWLDRPGAGDVGGLLTLRAAVGARYANRLVVELGYSAFAIGGTYNSERLEQMTLENTMELPPPETVISAGEASGLVDVSVGLTF